MDRLEEVLRLARGLYDHGAVTFEGAHVRRPRPPAPGTTDGGPLCAGPFEDALSHRMHASGE
jgi:hypothetical protein